ncbi:MAG: hypothetical protein PHH14_01865 [Candidatus Margulisbacteria bacterium]|nr:hypothetical protein [Candidatus Margulisiibacteriota bacterium]
MSEINFTKMFQAYYPQAAAKGYVDLNNNGFKDPNESLDVNNDSKITEQDYTVFYYVNKSLLNRAMGQEIESLLTCNRDDEALILRLRQAPYKEAPAILVAMGETKKTCFIGSLLKALTDNRNFIREAAAGALLNYGETIVPYVVSLIDQYSPPQYESLCGNDSALSIKDFLVTLGKKYPGVVESALSQRFAVGSSYHNLIEEIKWSIKQSS